MNGVVTSIEGEETRTARFSGWEVWKIEATWKALMQMGA
jgi:hypothetical protein